MSDKRKEMAELRNALRLFVASQAKTMTDAEALSVSGLHDTWADGTTYGADSVVLHNGALYRVVQQVTAQAHQPPDAAGMLAIYRPINIENAGTAADPIAYTYGMDVTAGLIYTYNGGAWKALKDMMPCVWPPAAGNEWEAVE